MPHSKPTIKLILSMPLGENSYVAHFDERKDCIVIDPGFEPDKILDYLSRVDKAPAAILCTHGHPDHIAGNAALKDRWPECPIIIGENEAEKLTDSNLNLSLHFGVPMISPAADRLVADGEEISYAGFNLEVYDTPGHSTGHVVFVWRDGDPIRIFAGDVLFQGSVGRVDIPGGDFADLRKSIHEKLFSLPDDALVLPGHGPPTTIGEEKASNPFVGVGKAR